MNLRPGATVALFAPAGAVNPEDLKKGLEILESWGLRVSVPERVFSRHRYLAGRDEDRLEELKSLLNKGFDALWAARGGYGCIRLLPALSQLPLPPNPPLILGFSDLTALLNPLVLKGLPVWHAPTVNFLPRLTPQALETLRSLLFGESPVILRGRTLQPGEACGPLLGGNLATLVSLMGTPYFPALKGALLFLEETGEALYRLDRYLTQLALAGVFEHLSGLILGYMGIPTSEILPLLEELLPPSLPVGMDFPLGHTPCTLGLPLGKTFRLLAAGKEASLTQTND